MEKIQFHFSLFFFDGQSKVAKESPPVNLGLRLPSEDLFTGGITNSGSRFQALIAERRMGS
jgi:hypothetical protein